MAMMAVVVAWAGVEEEVVVTGVGMLLSMMLVRVPLWATQPLSTMLTPSCSILRACGVCHSRVHRLDAGGLQQQLRGGAGAGQEGLSAPMQRPPRHTHGGVG